MNKQILLELTYDTLIRNTNRYFTKSRDDRASTVKVSNTLFIPYIDQDQLEIESYTRTTNGKYTTRLIFDNVIFRDEESPNTARIISADGTEYYFDRINRRRAQVKVNCTCLDFYYRFAAYNNKASALAADPPKPYIKTTDRPPVNPRGAAGLCKHIMRLSKELSKNNLFTSK